MAYTDPQSITISGTGYSLARVGMGVLNGSFSSSDGLLTEKISHTVGKARTRRVLRVDLSKVAADPFQTTINAKYGLSVQLHVDVPNVGFTIAEQKAVVDAVLTYLGASTGAKVTQLLGGES